MNNRFSTENFAMTIYLASLLNSLGVQSGNGKKDNGGNMNDLERRIIVLEENTKEIKNDINSIKTDVAIIKANIPHLASKEDLIELKAEFKTLLPHLSTKSELKEAKNSIILWFIATAISLGIIDVFKPKIANFITPSSTIQQPVNLENK